MFQQIITHMICSIWMAFLSYFAAFSITSNFCFCRPLSSFCHRFLVALVSLVLSILEMRVLYFAVKLPLLHRSCTFFTYKWQKSPTITYIRISGSVHSMPSVARLCLVMQVSMEGHNNKCQSPLGTYLLLKTHHCLIGPAIWRCFSGWKQGLV